MKTSKREQNLTNYSSESFEIQKSSEGIQSTDDPTIAKSLWEEGDEIPAIPRWKRFLDSTIAVAGLVVLLPTVVVVGAWVKLVSNGPFLFCQERVGLRGRKFTIYKFRTMKVNAETQTHERHFEDLVESDRPMTKLDAMGDPRLIPGGKLLRAIGLDELPQIFNVVRGEMSLVGPRPCTPNEFESYREADKERLNAPPGLTGYWQVNGKNRTTFREMIAMDVHYANNMSLWLDLLIIARTLPAIVNQVIDGRAAAQGQATDEPSAKPLEQ